MSRYILTIVDTTGIQEYIFGTNNLQHNVGASYLVECATKKWVVEALPRPHNVIHLDQHQPFNHRNIEDGLQAELIYAGGGNTVIFFANKSLAIEFAKDLTRRVIVEAPGLNLVLTHHDFDWSTPLGGKEGALSKAIESLAKSKANRPISTPTLGLSVTASCAFTGLPAVAKDRDDRLISSEIKAKINAEENAHKRLLSLVDFKDFYIPRNVNDLGTSRIKPGYIAVVHTDGNNMGSRIKDISNSYPMANQNRQCIEALRQFSTSLNKAALEALKETVDKLIHAIQIDEQGRKVIGDKEDGIRLQGNNLPFRPIVFGGDDTTFICHGRLGLTLTAFYLRTLSAKELSDGKKAHCRAGVAVVRTHYPFARAYRVSEALCALAKTYIEAQGSATTAIDWHFATTGIESSLEDIRNREYYEPEYGDLLLRPIGVTGNVDELRSWDAFSNIIRRFQKDQEWVERKNKARALMNILREGPDAVEHFCTIYKVKLPAPPEWDSHLNLNVKGWGGKRCLYFDAIEGMDFFIPLEGDGP